MLTLTHELSDMVADAFEGCGYGRDWGQVSGSDRLDLCQFQCNGAFACAKRYHKAPLAIAEEVAAVLARNPLFARVDAAPPGFLNLTLSDAALLARLAELAEDPHLGIPQEPGGTILIDYGGPNVAKPLHIGHLRSAIIGESLKRLARAMGRTVLGDVHLGDWGLQIGLVIAELTDRHPDWRCFSPDFRPDEDGVPSLTPELLAEVYPTASGRSKDDPAFKEKAQRATGELQQGRAGYLALWREILRVSVEDLKTNYRRLQVDFDLWYGESDAEPYVEPLLARLRERHLLRESEGALVVDVEEEGDKAPMPPVIVKKSDSSSIYATTDLATILQRERVFAPAEIWYVVDKRQSLHFTQVFRCAKKAGLVPPSARLEHLGFGTMNGSDGKPYKTRDGGVMRLSEFLDTVTDAAFSKMGDSAFVSKEEGPETARRLGLAAVKFGDLVNHRTKDYVFDLDKFLAFEGKTGVYLLYTLTRIQSILNKAGDPSGTCPSGIYTDVERELILAMLLTGDAFSHAFAERAPNIVCENAYRIASVFSRFYHDNHILGETDPDRRASWLSLCRLTKRLLLLQLDVLGIEPVDSM